MSRTSIIKVLKKLREHRSCVCPKKCKCKDGGVNLGTGYAGGDSYGCPELKICIKILAKMNNSDYHYFLYK